MGRNQRLRRVRRSHVRRREHLQMAPFRRADPRAPSRHARLSRLRIATERNAAPAAEIGGQELRCNLAALSARSAPWPGGDGCEQGQGVNAQADARLALQFAYLRQEPKRGTAAAKSVAPREGRARSLRIGWACGSEAGHCVANQGFRSARTAGRYSATSGRPDPVPGRLNNTARSYPFLAINTTMPGVKPGIVVFTNSMECARPKLRS